VNPRRVVDAVHFAATRRGASGKTGRKGTARRKRPARARGGRAGEPWRESPPPLPRRLMALRSCGSTSETTPTYFHFIPDGTVGRRLGVKRPADSQARQSNVDFHSFRRWFIKTARRAYLGAALGLLILDDREGGGALQGGLCHLGWP
jgi:hypothetical protein